MSTGDVERSWLRYGPPGRRPDAAARACRNLFGSPDHQETESLVRTQLDDIRKRDRLRWNFDTVTERPLPGRFQWVAAVDRTLPDDDSVQEVADPQVTHGRDGSTHHLDRSSGADDAADAADTALLGGVARCTAAARQCRITDFMRKRKPSSTAKVDQTKSPESMKLPKK